MRLLVLPLTDTRRTLGVGVGAFVLPLLDWLPVQLPLPLPLEVAVGCRVGISPTRPHINPGLYCVTCGGMTMCAKADTCALAGEGGQ